MTTEQKRKVLRLRKKHEPGSHERPDARDGARLIAAQSIRHALMAGLIVIIAFAVVWAMLSTALARVFPWMVLLLGILMGFAVRRGGLGIDWRFPMIAAVLTLLGAIVGNVVVSAALTAAEYETGTFTILRAVTTMTWPVFFDEVMTAADIIYALSGAGIAGFYANRRLSRREYQAVRIWKAEESKG